MKPRLWRTVCVLVSLLTYGSAALAQSAPPPAYPPPPPQATAPGYPPPAYPPPPGYPPAPQAQPQPYGAPPPSYRPGPMRMRYEEGDQIPQGYHVVNVTRQGPVIAGTIVFAVSYGIALSAAAIDNFDDKTGWFAVPVAGPWLFMLNRSRPDCTTDSFGTQDCIDRSLDFFLRFYVALDGVAQAVGAGLFIYGMNGRKILVRDDSYTALHIAPAPIGKEGYGAMISGRF